MEGDGLTSLVEVFSLDHTRELSHFRFVWSLLTLDGDSVGGDGRLVAVGIHCHSREHGRTFGHCLVGCLSRHLIESVEQYAVRIEPYLLDHVSTASNRYFHCGVVADGDGCRSSLDSDFHLLVQINTLEFDAVDVALSSGDAQTYFLLALLQRYEHASVYGLVVVEVANFQTRNRNVVGERCLVDIVAECQLERCVVSTGRCVSVERIESFLLHIHGVFHPFTGHGLAYTVSIVTDFHEVNPAAVGAVGLCITGIRGIAVVINDVGWPCVEIFCFDGSRQHHVLVVNRAFCTGREAAQTLVFLAVGGVDDGFQCVGTLNGRFVICHVRSLCHGLIKLILYVEFHMVDGLGTHPCTDGDRNGVANRHFRSCRFHIHRRLLLHSRERALGVLRLVASHVGAQPFHGRSVCGCPVICYTYQSGVSVGDPCTAVDVTPEGDAGAVAGLPHIWNLLLVALQLQVVVVGADIVFRAVHRYLQVGLQLSHRRLE